jgi:predicted ATPase/class 3 adenylate cyclase
MGHKQADQESETGIATLSFANPIAGILSSLPTGTVTFLFTDIEGSTLLWEHQPEAMQRAFSRHEAIVREAMAAHGGYLYKMIGDAFQVAFSTALAALAAALAAQYALHAEAWGPIGVLRVRMALHTGVTEERGDDYVGPDLNRIGRLLGAGHGGQILLSQVTAGLVTDHLPTDVSLRDLGEHLLRGLNRPERIYQVVAPGLPEDYPPLKTIDARAHNLPAPATTFVGREAELAQIAALLPNPQCRLISLVGPGGIGKTHLAIQAAALSSKPRGQQAFPDRVYFVDLAAITSPEGVVTALADALRMSFYVRPGSSLSRQAAQAQLVSYLADREALLVLDNCEQLVAGEFTDLVAELMAAAPRLKLITTSRERLSLPGEWTLEVAGLSFPGSDGAEGISDYAAVQLFVERARRAGPFVPEAADWPAIGRICQLLGGMPLGIEMAAAWTKVLSCQEIANELERDLLALTASWRSAPERHRTLRAVFDHSWRLLSDEERDAVCQLAVFRSGFQREAAAEVAGVSLALLGALIDKSFLRRTLGRFEVQPVVRQCAIEKLAADSDVAYAEARSRHARYYSGWLREMNDKLKGRDQLVALVSLRMETQNLHGAWRWLIEQCDLVRLHGVLPALILFHEMLGRPVGSHHVVQLLLDMLEALGYAAKDDPFSPAETDRSLLALGLAALRHFSMDYEHPEWTKVYQEHSLAIAQALPDSQEKAFTLLLNSMGPGTLTLGQRVDLCRQCVDIFQRLGDSWGTALAQLVLGDTAAFWQAADPEYARHYYQSSLDGFVTLGNEWGRALCLFGLAHMERQAGHLEEAYRMARQSLVIYCQIGDAWRTVETRRALGEIAEGLGRFGEARDCLEANLAHFSRIGNGPGQDDCRACLKRLDERVRAGASDLAHEVQKDETTACPAVPSPGR